MSGKSKYLLLAALLAGSGVIAAAVPEYLATGKSPIRLETMAEKELCLFYKQIYGKDLKKIGESEADGKSVIFLGNTDFARKNGVDPDAAGKEEWILKTVDDDLIVSGGRPAGTLYGVYDLLEKLGVVFAAPDATGLPDGKPDFPKFDEKKQPAFSGRHIYDGISVKMMRSEADEAACKQYRLWALRNRINGKSYPKWKAYYLGDYFNLSTIPYHNLGFYVDPRKYFKTHPEYFQMDPAGRRIKPKSRDKCGSLCMTNPDVKRITLETLRGFIKRDRSILPKEEWPIIYDISELDATDYICRCPECKKVIEEDGSETGLLLQYINYIAREIRKEYPDIIIRTSTNGRMPGKMMPEKNTLIRVATKFTVISPFVPLNLDDYPQYKKYFQAWVERVPRLQMWCYGNLGGRSYFTPPRVETTFDSIQGTLKVFLANKIVSMFIEHWVDAVSPQNFIQLNYYVTNHLMVDPDADPEKLKDEFFRVYYGPAAPVMLSCFERIRKGVRDYPQKNASSMSAGHWGYLTPEFMIKLYQDLHKAEKALPEGSRYAARIRHELITPVWYTLANWQSYKQTFEKAGLTKDMLITECRRNSREFVRRYPSKHPERVEKHDGYEDRFEAAIANYPRPEKFKAVPEQDFRMITGKNFRGVPQLGSKRVNDPESPVGVALKSANPKPEYHGVDKLLPGKHGFRTTEFVFSTNPGSVRTVLHQVYQDEKYHWYRIPGSAVLSDKNTFWGHGWAVQARANNWYTLTNGDPRDNTWDQIWFSAKFTGPAYVKGSTKENAIYVDMVVGVRNQPDPVFKLLEDYTLKKTDVLKDWKASKTCSVKLIRKDGRNALEVSGSGKKAIVTGPFAPCGPDDVIIVRVRPRGTGGKVTCRLYDAAGKSTGWKTFPALDSGLQNDFVISLPDVKKRGNVAKFQVEMSAPAGEKVVYDQLEVKIAPKLNLPKEK